MKETVLKSFAATRRRREIWDKAMVTVLFLCAASVLFILFVILWHLIARGLSSLNPAFFTQLPKAVGEKGGGMANAIIGTFVLLILAVCVGVPLGLGAGVYLGEYAHHRFAQTVLFVTDVMNGIPSIVFGIFAYTICVLPMKAFSALSGGLALGFMMIPMITRTSEQFVKMVPNQLREAGLALGLPKWRVVTGIIVPSAIGGIMTGIMVALARVAGETAPLLFTAFGNLHYSQSLTQPISAIPLQIFNYAVSPYEDWHRQAWAGALVLIVMVFLINIWAQYFVYSRKRWSAGK
ncbi:MAG: phosphate ABC transporter permease PstA [Candidatus Omnitrophica bacterium]|nr:phosphate ABC transporter permease PstA [Candidatus Omnitrophota bacterium]MDE2009769.1 phosphate ABC transporter permease PstA [Candidatus Omnitrophota bacterium]MDE2215480.1 phosphate ABC transporter permease PstA [Candidatus Omnitrophota bacterium]MDE2231468.1 phosphate ABC transporter permease PstA [Candidatus Omnitrophota bacterium]